MFTRRGFFHSAGAGVAAISSGCYPSESQHSAFGEAIGSEPLRQQAKLRDVKRRLLGYPINMNTLSLEFFAWRNELSKAGINTFAFNNVGNPFKGSPIPYNTHYFEREVIRHFGALFNFPEADTWGFLSHSGTDSNMHGMYMGRTILQGTGGVLPKCYFTREAHYSVQILSDLLGLESVMVNTLPDGGMDPIDLSRKVGLSSRFPALVVATIGTTFKGAVDNVDAIQEQLGTQRSYVHVDAALFGGYLPFTEYSAQVSHRSSESAQGHRYDSIAVSCHKFFGFPSPAGLFITPSRTYEKFNTYFRQIHNPEYIHHVPGTITCSRDAVKPAEFHYFTRPSAVTRQEADARNMLCNASYLLAHISHLTSRPLARDLRQPLKNRGLVHPSAKVTGEPNG